MWITDSRVVTRRVSLKLGRNWDGWLNPMPYYRYYEDIRKELKFDLLFTQAELAEQLC